MKVKVNVDNIPEEYREFVKPEMTQQEVALLGHIILKMKKEKLKNRWFGWYYERKLKRKNREKI